jgi:hypothetical protein
MFIPFLSGALLVLGFAAAIVVLLPWSLPAVGVGVLIWRTS